ncbi:hypothetical protein ACFYY1_39140 [Streptomyces sp. NPDC001890]|uniref:hypothetical protein n=1 Tax=Streptomyces sp. NPDC001890 TaxID=3364620 RepID=UPI0036812F28
MSHTEHPSPVMSLAEYQALTEEEVGEDLVVGGVVYNRSEWEPDPEDGVRRRTDNPNHHANDRITRARDATISAKRNSDGVPF